MKKSYQIIKTTFDGDIIKIYNDVKECCDSENLNDSTLLNRIHNEEYRRPICMYNNHKFTIYNKFGKIIYKGGKRKAKLFIQENELDCSINYYENKLFFQDRFYYGKKTK